MLYYLSDDPWPLAVGLSLVGLGFLITLWITQNGRFLVHAGIAFGLALLVLIIEQVWVTDAERIETVVYDLARAVKASDVEGIDQHLAPDLDRVERNGPSIPVALSFIKAQMEQTQFDLVNVRSLQVTVFPQSRTGRAHFGVNVSGQQGTQTFFVPAKECEWELGFRETEPGTWKVTEISPLRLPIRLPSFGGSF